ncbi:MAG: IS1595 family transposase [Streptosporangiaceae bacterium]
MSKQELSIPALTAMIPTEADAYLKLEELRWNGHPICPHCGLLDGSWYIRPLNGVSRKTRTGSQSQRRVWKCGGCRRQFSVLTGTIFQGSKIPVRTWLLVVFEMCAAKNGISAREVERKYDLTAKTAWFMLHRIREAMKREPLAGMLRGTVISDETWIGGTPANRHRNDPREQARLSSTTDKTPVLALVHFETREVRSRVVPNVEGKTLRSAIRQEVDGARTELWTDSAKPYTVVARDMRSHEAVNHEAGQYVRRGGITTNMAEGYFSQLKRSIDGTHHHVSTEHLNRYLGQFDFLYSLCKQTDSARMHALIRQAGGRRLSYRPLTTGR